MLVGTSARAAAFEDKVAALYRPIQAEQVTLAPDGRHVAYTQHARGKLYVKIVTLEKAAAEISLTVDEDREVKFSKEKEPSRLRFLRWVSPERLVIAPAEQVIESTTPEFRYVTHPVEDRVVPVLMPVELDRTIIAPIHAVDADGKNVKQLVKAAQFSVSVDVAEPKDDVVCEVELMRHTKVIGRLPGEPDYLLVQAVGGPPPHPKQPRSGEADDVTVRAMSGLPPLPRQSRSLEPQARAWRHLGPLPSALYKVHARTGKVTPLSEERYVGQFLYDWQGRPRIVQGQSEHSLVRPFLYRPGQSGRWREPSDRGEGSLPAGFTLSPSNYFGERSMPLGFDFDSKILWFASNAGRDTFGVYGLNVETKQRTGLAMEHPHFDLVSLEPEFPSSALVFDEHRRRLVGVRTTGVTPLTLWVDPELAQLQAALEKKFPRKTMEIVEWDDARTTFLLRVSGGGDPGHYFIYQGKKNRLFEFLRCAPWLRREDLHDSMPFEFDTAAGVHLTGYLTLPRAPRLNPPPLVMYLPAGFPSRAQPEFDREAQVLAGMGFVVARVNHRGAVGFGARHRDAIHAGVDRVPVEDMLATIEWIAGRHKIDRGRVATMGEGFGGYLALRALQLAPDTFRCAIAINAPLNLEFSLQPKAEDIDAQQKVDFTQEVHRAFFQRNATKLADISILRQPERLTKPVFLIVDSTRDLGVASDNRGLRARLEKLGRASEYLELPSSDFARGLPAARARVFRQMEEFFNLNLYDFNVKVGEAKETR